LWTASKRDLLSVRVPGMFFTVFFQRRYEEDELRKWFSTVIS
jgi:hypothetical protein